MPNPSVSKSAERNADVSADSQAAQAIPQGDELVTREQAREFLKLRGNTNHTLRRYELRGLLTPIRLSSRSIRYRKSEMGRLVAVCAGGAA